MSGRFLRKGSRLCFYGLLENRSITSNSSLAELKQWGAFARSPLLKQSRSKFCSVSSSTTATTSKNGIIGWYLGMIESRPILTKSITASLIFTAADVSSQMITVESSSSFDPIRTMRMAVYGLFFSGPTLHLWFNTISRILPKRDLLTTMKKLFIGQTVYGPIMTAVFFSVNAGLQGETPYEIAARLKRDLIPTLITGLVYWPMCDFITFKFIPVRLQPLISNSFSFFWTIYITYMASLKKVSIEKISVE